SDRSPRPRNPGRSRHPSRGRGHRRAGARTAVPRRRRARARGAGDRHPLPRPAERHDRGRVGREPRGPRRWPGCRPRSVDGTGGGRRPLAAGHVTATARRHADAGHASQPPSGPAPDTRAGERNPMKIWSLHGDGKSVAPGEVVAPSERLNWPATIAIGVQHVVAMFGATFLVPVLTGFPVPTTLLFSGVGTLLFLIITRNKLPSYLGSSFAFIAPVTAATASAGMGSALAGIVAVGILLAIVGVIANVTGTGWIDKLMPPVVAGAIVALIGFNLAPVAWS